MNLNDDARGSSGINILWPNPNNELYKEALQEAADGWCPNNISAVIKYELNGGVTALWMGDLETEFMRAIEDEIDLPPIDLSVHGGFDTAVYFYSRKHYASWEKLLGSGPLPPGSFGENVTSDGLLEEDLHIGDILRIGTATFRVLQPRSPCYKLQIRFGRPDMTALFLQQGKPGW